MSSALETFTFMPAIETDFSRQMKREGLVPLDTMRIVGGKILSCSVEEFIADAPQPELPEIQTAA